MVVAIFRLNVRVLQQLYVPTLEIILSHQSIVVFDR